MTDRLTDTRCEVTDLFERTCAHCRGDDPTIQPGEPLRGDVPVGVAVWPVKDPAPVYVARAVETATDDPKVKVSRDLRQIRLMATLLVERGEDLAGDATMPGGDATAAAAPVALPSAWERRVELTEAEWMRKQAFIIAMETLVATSSSKGRPAPEVDDWEPPLQSLLYWSELWRFQLGMAHEQWLNPTLLSEANFLASGDVLDWAYDHVPAFGSFAADIADARTRLENVVRDGTRTTRSRIVCDKPHPDRPHKRLNVLYGKGDNADGYISPCCHARYTPDEAKRAHARQMRAAGAEKWITTTEAVGALQEQGWQQRTIRKWIQPLRPIDRCHVCRRAWPAQEYAACPNTTIRDGEIGECGGLLEREWKGSREDVPSRTATSPPIARIAGGRLCGAVTSSSSASAVKSQTSFMAENTCASEGCEKPIQARGVCATHYWHLWKSGAIPKRASRPICTEADCAAKIHSSLTGLCNRHHKRLKRHGSTALIGHARTSQPGDETGYTTAHWRTRQERGSASAYACVDCHAGAEHWSYTHADPDEQYDARGYAFSNDPAFYEPRCARCHKAFDRAARERCRDTA